MATSWIASQCPKPVRRFVNTLPRGKHVKRSSFATFLIYNIPQAEPSAVSSATTSMVASSSHKTATSQVGPGPYALLDLCGKKFLTPTLTRRFRNQSPDFNNIGLKNISLVRSFKSLHAFNKSTTNYPYISFLHEIDTRQRRYYQNSSNRENKSRTSSQYPLDNDTNSAFSNEPIKVSSSGDKKVFNNSPSLSESSDAQPDNHNKPSQSNLGEAQKSNNEYEKSWMPQKLKNRPTKQELLGKTDSWLGRLNIHFRWALFKQIRPITTDDISAFFSWILVGHIIWILLGTTTFFSIILYAMNTVFAQEYIAEIIGNFITKETGLTVVFENAIVPHWSDGVISFNKVFVSRRPNRGNHRVQKGSQAAAAASALAIAEENEANGSNTTDDSQGNKKKSKKDSGNYTQFDLTIDTVSVTLSVSKWMNGGGIVQDIEVKGLRGIVDRRFVKWDPNDDPTNYKNKHQPGDFEIENFKMEDALVTLYHPNGFRPFKVSIFNCELPRLRKHWLFYDIISANNMSGTYDNSLFTIHPRQLEAVTSLDEGTHQSPWRKINRLRIDGVNIDHLNKGVEGPFGWIESGNVDMVADIMFPAEEENFNVTQVLRDIKDSFTNYNNGNSENKGRRFDIGDYVFEGGEWKKKAKTLSSKHDSSAIAINAGSPNDSKYVVIDYRIQLNNARAVVPLFTSQLTYINNALIRPIVAYINSRDTYIPINCRIIKRYDDFEGSWTVYDSRLMDDVSAAVYDAFAANIMDDEARAMRMKKVGFWSLQLALQLFLISLGAIA